MNTAIYILDIFGTLVFAVAGALAAGRKRMDIFGVVVLGSVTALGGGTLRDIILGVRPVFWISSREYLAAALAASLGTFALARRFRLPPLTLLYADALGLAAFTVIGFQVGFDVTGNYITAVVMGVMTGVAGGIIRDLLSGSIPLILCREIYASASLCGAALLALLTFLGMGGALAVSVSVLTTLAIRIVALRKNLSLPLFSLDE